MKKILLLFCALLATMGAGATVTQPTLTTDANNPTYYVIQNFRSGKYANFAGESAQLTQVESSSVGVSALWYFVANGDGVSIVPATAPTLKLATTSSATEEGAVWYIPENPYNSGTFCVSLTSGATANCWDDQGSHTTIGYWRPAEGDYAGTSWYISEIPVTKAEVDAGTVDFTFALNKLDALARLLPFASLSVYTDANVAAVRNATDATALNTALKAFETNITLFCRSNKYLVVGESACSYNASPTGFEEIIQLVSAGNGTFYLKGYKSEKYIGNVTISTAITTDATPTTAFYFESYNGYTVVRPSDTSSSYDSYRYIHNGGSGCVGWSADGDNTQHTIAEVELPSSIVDVTYHLMVDGVDKTQSTVTCGVGDAPDASVFFSYPYTTLAYDVETIASNTTDVYVTATFNLPFTASTDYESATWYYATLRGKQLRADEGHKDDSGRYQTNSSNERTDVYKWAFIGNPIEGIKIINKGAGSGKYLYKGDQPTIQEATPSSDANARWYVSPNSNGGFTVCSASTANWYINDAGNKGVLGFWANTAGANDAGSNWVIDEVTASDKTALGEAISLAQTLIATPDVIGYPTAAAASTLSNAISVAQGIYNDAAGDYITAYNTLNEAISAAKTNIVYTPRTDVYYTITSNRGSMVYDASHDNHEDADGNKFLWYTTSLDNTNVNHLWGFIEQDGKYYMYNVGRKQFATVSTSGSYQLNDKGTWAFSDAPAYMTFDAGINNSVAAPNVRIRATVATTGSSYSMSISTSYIGPVITYDAQGDGGIPMRFATSTVAVDADITAEMIEKVEDIAPYFTTLKNLIDACALLPIGDGTNQYATTAAYSSALEAANTTYANTEATKSELQTATSNLESAIASLTLNLPAAGFYRIKGKTSGKYLAAGLASNNKFNMSDATDATTIFYFDGSKLTNFGSGMCNGMTKDAWAWVTGDAASTVAFVDGETFGGYAIQSSNAYFYDGGTSADRGSSLGPDLKYRSWYLEEVNTLPVTLSELSEGNFYATMCLPVEATIEGATVYTVAKGEGNVLTTTEVEGNIPAGTPVVLKGTAANATATLTTTSAEAPLTTTGLVGTYVAIDFDGSADYTLGTDATKPAFIHSEETVLKGFSAYIAGEEGSAVEAYYFDFDAPEVKKGDVNNDGSVTIADVTALVNIILGKDNVEPYQYNHAAADVNGDEGITIADVTALVNIILGKTN